ncbi:MAG: tripartite tricarboxylate transporter TctB family protein [Geminicoccaceae bacterium]
MRLGFTAAILCLAVLYTYWAFAELSFLSSTGRLGPGFFPRIVGLLLIAACLLTLTGDLKARPGGGEVSGFWRITVVVGALSGAFILLLEILGGPLAMVVYLLATLSVLNRDRTLQNVAISVGLPLALFLLFDRWLNASIPPDALGLPW